MSGEGSGGRGAGGRGVTAASQKFIAVELTRFGLIVPICWKFAQHAVAAKQRVCESNSLANQGLSIFRLGIYAKSGSRGTCHVPQSFHAYGHALMRDPAFASHRALGPQPARRRAPSRLLPRRDGSKAAVQDLFLAAAGSEFPHVAPPMPIDESRRVRRSMKSAAAILQAAL